MNARLKKVQKEFNISVIALATASVLLLGFILYEANIIRFSDDISSTDLSAAVEKHPEVKEYLESEHQNEAHFITIANIIKNDQQKELGRIMLLATIPVVVLAAALGSIVAKRLLKPVEEAHEAQERFIADAAHELRNPLATMSAILQRTNKKQKITKDEVQKNNLSLSRQVKRMVAINEDLLYLERGFNDSKTDTSTNISELLEEVLEDLQPFATRRNITFKTSISENVISSIEPKQFVRLAKNIVENAIKYSKDSSKRVEIALSADKNRAQLVVKDYGIGIPSKDIDSVSERFFRAHNASSLDGTGLGLAIVQKILDHHGGKLHIVSEKSKGTTVSVEIHS